MNVPQPTLTTSNEPSKTTPSLTTDQILRSQELSLSRLISSGSIADSRGAVIISSNIAMLGALVAALSGTITAKAELTIWVLAGLTVVLSVSSIAAAATGAYPRTGARFDSIVFFGGISRLTRLAYCEKLNAISSGDYARDLIDQCHRVATLTTFKFRCVRVASSLLLAAAVPWLFCLYSAHRLPLPA